MVDITKIELNDIIRLRNGEECIVTDNPVYNDDMTEVKLTLRDHYQFDFDGDNLNHENLSAHSFSTTYYTGGDYLRSISIKCGRDMVEMVDLDPDIFLEEMDYLPPLKPGHIIENGLKSKIRITDGVYEFDGENHWNIAGRRLDDNKFITSPFSFNRNCQTERFIAKVYNDKGELIYDYYEAKDKELKAEREEAGYGCF